MDFEGAFFDTNDYEPTEKKIGEGAFGKVYIVENESTNEQYAAKIVNSKGELNGHEQMMLLRESLILHKLKHPAIVKFIGINLHSFDNPDKLEPTIITEYVSHGSLKEILKKEQNSIADSKWTPTKKYICLLGIADALRYLHQHGIVHRDLKPENVLVDENYYPRVCDFGLSRCFSFILSKSVQLSMTGKIGTPLYMAPELMMDEDKYGPGIDVYSFAILAYEIVSGKEPFSTRGKSIKLVDLGNKVMSGGRPEFTEGVTEKMKDLITQCWSQDYKDRPSFDEIFKKLSTDFSYLDEDVEEDEIQEYLETLKEETELIPPLPTIEEMQQIRNKNEELESLLKKITDENAQLKKVNRKASHDIKKLTTENTQLKKDNEKISNDNEKLTKENTQLKKDNEKISNDNEKLTKENAQLKKDNKKANNDDKKLTEKEHKDKKKKYVHDTPKISKIPKVSSSATTEIKYKQTLIIDNGSGCIRSGFASNELPKSIFPTIVGRTKNASAVSYSNDIYVGNEACSKADALVLKRPIERGIITNWEDIEKIWHHAFYNELHVDPSEHPVLLTEAPLNPKQNREKLIQIMFETFNVPSFYVINQAVLSLYSTGRTIGIVLNSGYDITHAVPINNYIIPHATTSIPLAGNELTIWLQEILKERGYTFKTSSEKEIVVDIKEEHGYVVLDYISELQKARSSSKYDVFYTLPNKTGITIGDELFRCPELLFKPLLNGYEFDGIDRILFDSIMKCDINVRKDMYSNIVLSGGTTMFEGLEERIEKEMMNMAPPSMTVKVHAPPERKHAAFIGGSILASLTTFHQMTVTNDEYNDVGPAIVHQKCL